MVSDLNSKLWHFSSINLTELNATASYLKRIDRKFLVTENQLQNILEDLKGDFQALDINGKRIFSYDNVYMDTPDYFFYDQHENKVESRTKIRTRLYKDSDLAFFEYKQKENGVTKKFRYQFPVEEHGKMTKGKTRFFEGVFQSLYDEKAPAITPAIRTSYNRLTLVNKTGEERLTIDFNIKIQNLRDKRTKAISLNNLVIIESKSMSDDCKSCTIIKSHGVKQAKSCSKYSLGVVYSGLAEKWETFKATMDEIAVIRKQTTQKRSRKARTNAIRNTLKHSFVRKPLATTKK